MTRLFPMISSNTSLIQGNTQLVLRRFDPSLWTGTKLLRGLSLAVTFQLVSATVSINPVNQNADLGLVQMISNLSTAPVSELSIADDITAF